MSKTVEFTASKRVRKATSSNEGSCSVHANGQDQLQQGAGAAAASQVHGKLARPGQEAGTGAAAGQVQRQPQRGGQLQRHSQPGGPPTAGAAGQHTGIS